MSTEHCEQVDEAGSPKSHQESEENRREVKRIAKREKPSLSFRGEALTQ